MGTPIDIKFRVDQSPRVAPGPRDGSRRVALVAGASGGVGHRLAQHLSASQAWDVIGIARRPLAEPKGYTTIAVDLTNAQACASALVGLEHVTDIMYCARFTHTAFVRESADTNGTMFRNLVEAIEPVAPGLAHVHVMQGSKYYGMDLGPYKTPAKETDPRILLDLYYYQQEDFIRDQSRGKSWTWSASIPHAVCDYAPGFPRSLPMVIAVYAAICKELGLPLCFPGPQGNYTSLFQCTDATLLANAAAWMATEPRCAGERFNVTNGDYFRWCNLWPSFAKFFGMDVGPVRTIRLVDVMADKGPLWERIVTRHGLLATPYERAALWSYGDFIFSPQYDVMSETRKLREFGFMETLDTERMFLRMFDFLRAERVIP